jgi:hypothetical protein
MTKLFDIPSDCLYDLLLKWLFCAEFCLLDTALVSKQFRVLFLELLSDTQKYAMYVEIHGVHALHYHGISFIRWLNLRDLRCDELHMSRQVLNTIESDRSLLTAFRAVESVSLSHCTSPDVLEFVLHTCPIKFLSL